MMSKSEEISVKAKAKVSVILSHYEPGVIAAIGTAQLYCCPWVSKRI